MQELFGQIETALVGCYKLQDALVAPTGIAAKDGVAFTSAAFLHPPHHVTAIADRLNAEDLPMRDVAGPLAVIYGPASETYGHWLTDFLPRLWVLRATGHDLASLKFVVPWDLPAFAEGLLAALGIGAEQLVRYWYWQEVLRTDLLLMPTGLRAGDRISPLFAGATRFWVDRVCAEASLPVSLWGERIFVSRSGAPQARQMSNREAIERAAMRRGFTLVQPERFSFLEQISMFRAARKIVGEYGSALHGSVFSPAGAVVCGLRGTARHPSFVQSGIGGALGQRVGYVFGETDGEDAEQRFAVEEGVFELALDITEVT